MEGLSLRNKFYITINKQQTVETKQNILSY